jgi:hypothetical protein
MREEHSSEIIWEEFTIEVPFLAMPQDKISSSPHTDPIQTWPDQFGRLSCKPAWQKTCPTSARTRNYRDVLRIPRYRMMDRLTGQRQGNHHLLWFAILPVGSPDLLEVEHEVTGTALHHLLHAADGFL